MSSRPLVSVVDYLTEPTVERSVLHSVADLVLLGATDESEVIERAAEADVLLAFHEIRLTGKSLSRLPRCKGVVRCGVGFDNVDLRAAGEQGIVVCNVPDYGTEEVADHALMLLLATTRRLTTAHNAIVQGTWDPTHVFGAPRLRGMTLGLIGCGRIGSAMARRALPLGLRVVFYDPYQPDGYDKALGIERCYSLEEMLPKCQAVSVHCLLSHETRHILNAHTLSLLPPGAYVVNTARGGCIDLAALYDSLETGQVAFAGLDVLETEPKVEERLRCHPRVVFTPHAAFYSVEGFTEMRLKAAEEAKRIILGQAVRNPVNTHCLVNARCKLPPVREQP